MKIPGVFSLICWLFMSEAISSEDPLATETWTTPRPCHRLPCKQGACRFEGCVFDREEYYGENESVIFNREKGVCPGGACYFKDCVNPKCEGTRNSIALQLQSI